MTYPEVIIDAKEIMVHKTKLQDRKYIKQFVNEVIDAIHMEKWGTIRMQYAYEPSELRGWTCFQGIITSNLTLHLFEEENSLYLNVFSCKDFDENVVLDKVRTFFNPAVIRIQRIARGFEDD